MAPTYRPPMPQPSRRRTSRGRILVVDDDDQIRQPVRLYLERDGYRVEEAATGPATLQAAGGATFDLILLDVMLPGIDGLEVCRRLREVSDTPIMLLTARSGDSDKVVGLDLGADDYVVKPFSPRELMARIRALLRRGRPADTDEPILMADGLVLDPNSVTLTVDAEPVDLTASEFRLLRALMTRPMRVFSRDELIGVIHGGDDSGIVDRTVDVHLGRLRRKLRDSAAQPRFIGTVRSLGYRFLQDVVQAVESGT
jgi:DNA-binding response OmpR family regulator